MLTFAWYHDIMLHINIEDEDHAHMLPEQDALAPTVRCSKNEGGLVAAKWLLRWSEWLTDWLLIINN